MEIVIETMERVKVFRVRRLVGYLLDLTKDRENAQMFVHNK